MAIKNSLLNLDNYKLILHYSIPDIIKTYLTLVPAYITLFFEKIKFDSHCEDGYFFILNRGLVTIGHVFNLILLYTKNLNVAYVYSQKALYYYIEFIEEVFNFNQELINLNSIDAVIFVYKRTIFEINNNIKINQKLNTEESATFKLIHKIIQRINNTNTNTNKKNKIDIIDFCNKSTLFFLNLVQLNSQEINIIIDDDSINHKIELL